MRSTTILPSLGEALREYLAEHEIGPPEPSLFELQAVPFTHVAQSDLDTAREDLANLIRAGVGQREVVRVERKVSAFERQLAYALRRDALQADRPETCWCLGAGGRNPRYVPIPTGKMYVDEHTAQESPEIDERQILSVYCPCIDGELRRVQDDESLSEYKNIRTARLIRRLFGESHIPKEYQRFKWRDLPKRNAVARISGWLAAEDWKDAQITGHPWLLLYGEPGRGKTTAASGIASELIEAGIPVLFRPMPDLLQEIKATYNPSNEGDESDLIALLKRVPWLFLDDIGAEQPTGWEGERLYQILNHRHNEHLPTVFTSNLDPEALSEHLGDRMYGRIKRMALPVLFGGDDLRDMPHAD